MLCLEGAWIVHGKRCMAFLYTPVSIKKDLSKRKAFLVPGCRTRILEYLATQNLHILCCHLTWIAAVLVTTRHGVKWEPRQT